MTNGNFSARDAMQAANKAEKNGDYAEAIALYSEVLSHLPRHPTASKKLKKLRKKAGAPSQLTQSDVTALGNLLQTGQMESASKAAAQLILIAPKEPVLYNFQGIALSYLGESKKAESSFRSAIRLKPNYAEALGNLGTLLCDAGRAEEAITVLKKTIKLKPNAAEANNSLGLALCQVDGHREALQYFDAALKIRPTYENAFNSKGLALKELGETDQAIETYKAGLKLNPSNVDLLTNLGFAFSQANRESDAAETLLKVTELDPQNAEIFMRLGVVHSQLGELGKATDFLQKSIAIDPNKAESYRILSTLKKFSPDDPEINAMKAAFDNPKAGPVQKMHLSFALGKAFEDVGDHEAAFGYWAAGNAAKRKGISYSIEQDMQLFEEIRRIFDADFFNHRQLDAYDTKQTIFVVGMMRSGTTLVEQILASHSKVVGEGELLFINGFARENFGKLKSGFDIDLGEFAKEYFGTFSEESRNSSFVVDKLPINFLWVGLIKAAMPNAKIINLVRDPRAVGLSIYKNYFESGGNQYAYDLEELGEFYVLYLELMEHWRQVLPGFVYDIQYENVVSDLKGEARKLLDYCGLDWEDNVLEFQSTDRVVKTASVAQVREKIYQSSVKGWRNFEKELEPFIRILRAAKAI